MKLTFKTLSLLLTLTGLSHAAVTISGTVGTSFKSSDGTTNIPVGSLFMVIADSGTTGFLGQSGESLAGSLNGLTSSTDPGVLVANSSITAGQTFGGDRILSVGSFTTAGVMPTLLSSVGIAGFEGTRFAVIWFEKSAATLGTEGLDNQKYGIISGADWVLPAADSGTFTMSSTDATPSTNYFSFSTNLSAAQLGTSGFFTGSGLAGDANADIKSATFTIVGVPEPSTILLGALGALGLLRRRRI